MIKNARIVKVDAEPEEYRSNAPRGDKGFKHSSSSLRLFWRCPDKWRTPIENEDGTTSWWEGTSGTVSTKYGDLFDCLVLTPQQFDRRYSIQPKTYGAKANACPSCGSVSDAKTCRKCDTPRVEKVVQKPWNNNSDDCRPWVEKQNGRTIITESELFKARQGVKRFLAHPGIRQFIDGCHKQVWIEAEWHDPKTNIAVPLKCLIDLLPNPDSDQAIVDPSFARCVADIKTSCNAAPGAWESWAHKAGYEVQAALNIDMAAAALKAEFDSFEFLISENYPPFQPARESMTNDPIEKSGDVDSGRRQYVGMLEAYCMCLKTGKWPGYGDHDEAANGVSICRPDPFKEQSRMFSRKFVFDESEPEEPTEQDDDNIP